MYSEEGEATGVGPIVFILSLGWPSLLGVEHASNPDPHGWEALGSQALYSQRLLPYALIGWSLFSVFCQKDT